ncbi:MAG: maf protein [Actinobacteria bacterium]|nr:maf protein [Actinomycetota bacterium]
MMPAGMMPAGELTDIMVSRGNPTEPDTGFRFPAPPGASAFDRSSIQGCSFPRGRGAASGGGAADVSRLFPDAFVLSADTVVVVDDRLLGKPADRREAGRMLAMLSGREHLVHTAVCLFQGRQGRLDETCVTTRVRFRPLAHGEIAAYLRTGECDDKAGAYAAQGAGNLLIERISGSFTNVVGLPMTHTLAMLRRAGLLSVDRSGAGLYVLAGGKP